MGFEFLGERSPELAGLEPRERRRRYLTAARRSWLHLKTWVGLALFLVLVTNAETFTKAIYSILDKRLFDETHTIYLLRNFIGLVAMVCLGGFQVSAIRAELRYQTKAQPCDRA